MNTLNSKADTHFVGSYRFKQKNWPVFINTQMNETGTGFVLLHACDWGCGSNIFSMGNHYLLFPNLCLWQDHLRRFLSGFSWSLFVVKGFWGSWWTFTSFYSSSFLDAFHVRTIIYVYPWLRSFLWCIKWTQKSRPLIVKTKNKKQNPLYNAFRVA